MRFNLMIWIAAATLLGAKGAAQSLPDNAAGSDALLSLMAEIPPCGLTCLIQEMPSIGCTLVDVECQCTSQNSTEILQPCLLDKCTLEETFTLLRLQGNLCNRPHNNRSAASSITGWVSAVVSIIAISIRFLSRYIGGNKFWWDDWLHMAAVVLIVPASVILIFSAKAGVGYHLWDLTYPQVRDISRFTYILTPLWAVNLLFLKFSILTLYLRIFPHEWLRRSVAAFTVFTILYTVPLIFLAAFQCNPVHAVWDLEAQKTAKCIDWIAVLRATVVFEVIAEIVLFLLPIPVVMKLQMPKAKKVLLMGFFGMGIGIIGVSIARLPTLPGVISKSDQTYTVVPSGITGFCASIAGHICTTIPTLGALHRALSESFKRMCGGGRFRYKYTNTFDHSKLRSTTAKSNSTEDERKGWLAVTDRTNSNDSRFDASHQQQQRQPYTAPLNDPGNFSNYDGAESFNLTTRPQHVIHSSPRDEEPIPINELRPIQNDAQQDESQRPFSWPRDTAGSGPSTSK